MSDIAPLSAMSALQSRMLPSDDESYLEWSSCKGLHPSVNLDER
jgi:hypothetical protein